MRSVTLDHVAISTVRICQSLAIVQLYVIYCTYLNAFILWLLIIQSSPRRPTALFQ